MPLTLKEDVEAEEKRKRDFAKKKEYFKALTNQLGDATSKKAQAEEQYAKDKGMVDEIIRTIEHEEMQWVIFIFCKFLWPFLNYFCFISG